MMEYVHLYVLIFENDILMKNMMKAESLDHQAICLVVFLPIKFHQVRADLLSIWALCSSTTCILQVSAFVPKFEAIIISIVHDSATASENIRIGFTQGFFIFRVLIIESWTLCSSSAEYIKTSRSGVLSWCCRQLWDTIMKSVVCG